MAKVSTRSYHVMRASSEGSYGSYYMVDGDVRHVEFPDDALEPTGGIAAGFRALIPDDGKEHSAILALNAHGKPLACGVVSTGSVDNCPLFPRDLFGWAIQVPGARFVGVAHNHPSGVVTPSGPDVRGTGVVAKAGALIGLDLVWSLVVTHESEEWAEIKMDGKRPERGEDGEKDTDAKRQDEQEQEQEGDEQDGEQSDEQDGDEPEPEESGIEVEAEQHGGNGGGHNSASPDDVKAAVARLLKRRG